MMTRLLLSFCITAIIALSITLTACANPSVKDMALQAQKADPLLAGFGTLADSNNPADMAAASVYTRLALYRQRAAAYLRNGLIPISQAKAVQAIADTIRSHLDRARANSNLTDIQNLSELLDDQIKQLEKS